MRVTITQASMVNVTHGIRRELLSGYRISLSQNGYVKTRRTDMVMIKTGNPIPTAPSELIQGYLDGIAGRDASSDDAVYKSGYDLALLVKEGKAEPPAWSMNV